MINQLLLSLHVQLPWAPPIAIKLYRRYLGKNLPATFQAGQQIPGLLEEGFHVHCGTGKRADSVYEANRDTGLELLGKGEQKAFASGIEWNREVESATALAICNQLYSTPLTLFPDSYISQPADKGEGNDYKLKLVYSPDTFETTGSIEFKWEDTPPEGWSHFAEVATRLLEIAEPDAVLATRWPMYSTYRIVPRPEDYCE